MAGGVSRPGTFDRGIAIIERLAAEDRPVTVRQLGTDLNLPSSTLYRLLATLEARGLVSFHLSGAVTLGPVLMDFGLLARRDFDRTIGSIVRPTMYELTQRYQESAVLMMPAGERAVCVEYVGSSHPVRLAFEVGRAMPLFAGAACKTILAYLDEPRRRRVTTRANGERRADGSTFTAASMAREIAEIRASGRCVTEDEVNPGTTGIAVPVRLGKDIIGSLTLAGPTHRFTPRNIDRMIEALLAASAQATQRIAADNAQRGSAGPPSNGSVGAR
jgi:DNA-binding IclR family transcriptional regulator